MHAYISITTMWNPIKPVKSKAGGWCTRNLHINNIMPILTGGRSLQPPPQWHPQVPLREGLTDQAQSVVAPAQKLSETHESEACGGHLVAASSATPYGKLTVWEKSWTNWLQVEV